MNTKQAKNLNPGDVAYLTGKFRVVDKVTLRGNNLSLVEIDTCDGYLFLLDVTTEIEQA